MIIDTDKLIAEVNRRLKETKSDWTREYLVHVRDRIEGVRAFAKELSEAAT